MKSLSKQQQIECDRLIAALAKAETVVEAAIDAHNRALDIHRSLVDEAVTKYNALVDEANGIKHDAQQEIGDYIADKSEKWQTGDRGSAYQGWCDSFDSDLPEIEVELPDDLETPSFDARAVMTDEWQMEFTE